MMGLFLSMLGFVIGFIYKSARESDRRKMAATPPAGEGPSPMEENQVRLPPLTSAPRE